MCGLGGRDRDQGLPMYWNLLDQSTSVHCVQHTGQHRASTGQSVTSDTQHCTRGQPPDRETQILPKLCPVSMETGSQDNG